MGRDRMPEVCPEGASTLVLGWRTQGRPFQSDELQEEEPAAAVWMVEL